jgi:adenylosuccinate synthase
MLYWYLNCVGHFDAVATRYALAVTGPIDLLAVTHIDRLRALPEWKLATHYTYRGRSTDLADYFVTRGEALTGIRVSERPDLDHQACLTQHLQHCTPHYLVQPATASIGVDASACLDQIEAEAGVPIGIASAGPTALDKRLTSAWAQYIGTKTADLARPTRQR